MNHKSFQISSEIDFLLFRDVNDDHNPLVKIYVYWMCGDNCLRQTEEVVIFDYPESAQAFISDFTEASALKWIEIHIPEKQIKKNIGNEYRTN